MEWLNDENFISVGIPDMLYEEDMEADYIDSPEPYDPSATAGNIEEEGNVYDEYLGTELYFDISPDSGPRKGTIKKCLKGKMVAQLGGDITTHSLTPKSMMSKSMAYPMSMLQIPLLKTCILK